METKNSIVRRLVSEGKYKEALGICKEWDVGISLEDRNQLRRGYECIVHPRFYESIGFNTDEEINKTVEVLLRLYT